jgi:hypothetical protein
VPGGQTKLKDSHLKMRHPEGAPLALHPES